MPNKKQGWITFQSSEDERQLLEEYCQKAQRTKTDVLRELLRKLGDRQDSSDSSLGESEPEYYSTQVQESLNDDDLSGDLNLLMNSQLENDHQPMATALQSIRISARNIIPGTVKRMIWGQVYAEVVIEVAPGVELVSSITRTSAEYLKLQQGKKIYAVIKSNNIMIAED
jgi:molybdopterin-binding protein